MSAPEAAQPVTAQPPTVQPSGPPPPANPGQPPVGESSLGRKRSLSPQKDERASKVFRKDPKELDLRAEEEAARRLNAGKAAGNWTFSGARNRGKKTELFAPHTLRNRLASIGKDHGLTFDEDTMNYIAVAAETRIRALLASSLHAQRHRTTSHHLHAPPLAEGSKKPLWSQTVKSSPNAVMELLARQNREAEQTFRASRMDRLARETEQARVRERMEQAQSQPSGGGGGDDAPASAGPSTPREKPSGTPVFGAVALASDKKKSGSSKKAGSGKDVSAAVQHRMSNSTAISQTGMAKKYAWMTNAPAISSKLKPKKSKTSAATPNGDEGGPSQAATPNGDADDSDATRTPTKAKRKKAKADAVLPTLQRRSVVVGRDANGERRVLDDGALTMVDLVWAMERDTTGKGMGSLDELVHKVYARQGGPWGSDEAPPDVPKKL